MELMKVGRVNYLKLIWVASFVGILGTFSYFRILPGLFPSIRSIEPGTLTGQFDPRNNEGVYLGQKVISYDVPSRTLAHVLGANDANKRIEIDLTNQKLYAFEGDAKVYDFLISSGKWFPTPTGTFRIWGKFRYTKMEGGNSLWRTYYYLPNVPFVMFFSNDKIAASRGFSMHGTYWHHNFGHPMSHGCVNMRTEDAAVLYEWTAPNSGSNTSSRVTVNDRGTEVVIYGVAPKE